jgi:Flp pilus assembly protein TadG
MAADRRGSVATEFSMLAIPFMFLVFALIENCVAFAAQELLANATDDIARQMRTGQIKPTDATEVNLKQMVCERIKLLAPSTCLSDVSIDLKEYATFEEAAKETIKVEKDDIVIKTSATSSRPPAVGTLGKAGTKNTLRVFYKWPLMLDFVAQYISQTPFSDKRMLHFATATWQNEPFND